jgi:hypothetical protein
MPLTQSSCSAVVVLLRYAAKVAKGYRPSQPKKMSQELWDLISACWHQDPIQRPHITEVSPGGGVHRGGGGGSGGEGKWLPAAVL